MNRLSFLAIFLLIISCIRDRPSELVFREFQDSAGRSWLKPGAPLNFASVKTFILEPKCLSCHSGASAKPENDPIDFSTYETTMVDRFIPLLVKGDPEDSRLYHSVETGEMPPKKRLTNEEIEFIHDWIDACAPEETPDSIPDGCSGHDDDGDDDDGPGDEPGGDEPGGDEPGF